MTRPRSDPTEGRSRCAVDALLRLREIQDHQCRERLVRKQKEVRELELELADLRRQRESILRRGGDDVLGERRYLDDLLQMALRAGRRLERLHGEAKTLREAYLESHRGKEAVRMLRDRRQDAEDRVAGRRSEDAAGDLASSRRGRAEDSQEEGT